jgi:hypothetical protein
MSGVFCLYKLSTFAHFGRKVAPKRILSFWGPLPTTPIRYRMYIRLRIFAWFPFHTALNVETLHSGRASLLKIQTLLSSIESGFS